MHRKKMTAPIVVTFIMVIYYAAYFSFLVSVIEGVWRYVFAVVPLLLSIMTVKVCVDRINEIKRGEEDDIGKY